MQALPDDTHLRPSPLNVAFKELNQQQPSQFKVLNIMVNNTFAIQKRAKSFEAHQKKLGVKAKATDSGGGRLSCEQTLNKFHSTPNPKYTI